MNETGEKYSEWNTIVGMLVWYANLAWSQDFRMKFEVSWTNAMRNQKIIKERACKVEKVTDESDAKSEGVEYEQSLFQHTW